MSSGRRPRHNPVSIFREIKDPAIDPVADDAASVAPFLVGY